MSDQHSESPCQGVHALLLAAMFVWSAWAALAAGSAAPATAPAAVGQRGPVPSAAAVEKARRLVHELFAEDYAARTPDNREALAEKLFHKSAEAQDDPVARYVLLSEARDLAVAAGNAATALSAIDALDAAYAIDGLQLKLAALTTIERANPASADSRFADAALNLAYPAFARGDFETTAKFATLSETVARRCKESSISDAAHELVGQTRLVAAATATLARTPGDRNSATVVGAYTCFVRNDWPKGLGLLARGSDPILAALAVRDLKQPAQVDEQFELAGAWWDAAQKQCSLYQNGVEAHASDLYRKAMPGLKTLARSIAEKRVATHPLANRHKAPAASAEPVAVRQPGDSTPPPRQFKNSLGMTLVSIPLDPNGFDMGSPATEPGRMANERLHHVNLTRPYWMATTHVTVAQFAAFIKATNYVVSQEQGLGPPKDGNPTWTHPNLIQKDDHPVVCVSWDDANAFCAWLSKKEDRHYRLPTEAEWEYAARAGTKTAYFWGDNPDDGKGYANGLDHHTWVVLTNANRPVPSEPFSWSDDYLGTSPVGTYKPNRFGLYDMAGNVQQWVSDFYGLTSSKEVVDPTGGDGSMPYHMLRGGGWFDGPRGCRAACRTMLNATGYGSSLGFRICFEMPEKTGQEKQ